MITRDFPAQALRASAAFIITFQIGFGFSALAYATPARKNLTAEDFAAPLIKNLMLDPVFAEFAKQPNPPTPRIIDPADPAVDQDPFFLRSQSWGNLNAQADSQELSYSKERGAVSLNIPMARKSLRIEAPLSPVLMTEEYIFLSADEGSDLFAKASGKLEKGEQVGEGLFFINVQDWLQASQASAPVKVHFFPLPGHGWTGNIEADHYGDLETLSIASQDGDWLPLSMEDVRQVEKVQSLNALLGAYLSAKAGYGGGQALYPARGSTYGFGMLFTGFDLDYTGSVAQFGTSNLKPLWASILKAFSLNEAKADVNISADLIVKLMWFGKVFGSLVALAIAAKYTVFRAKFVERRALKGLRTIPMLEFDVAKAQQLLRGGITSREALAQAPVETISSLTGLDEAAAAYLKESAAHATVTTQEGTETSVGLYARVVAVMKRFGHKVKAAAPAPIRKAGKVALREVTEVGDVLAANLTVVSQIPSVVTANVVERLADRYLPNAAAGSNRLLRKTLNYGLLWGRSVSTNTPVSMKTFMLGAVVMGSIDTYFVYLQQVAFVPWMAHGLAPYLPPALEQRIYDTYDPDNQQTRQLIANDVIRNFVAWLTSGASGYSQDTQAQLEPQVRKQVDDALKRLGMNPLAPESQEERDKMYQTVMNTKLKQFGLPDQADFLYDVNTIDEKVLEKLGYKVTDQDLAKAGESSVLGAKRPALIGSALRHALKTLKKNMKEAPSDSKLKAYRILEDMRKNISLFSFDPRNPQESLRQRRELLKMLSLLTYAGDVDTVVRHVPELWQNVDPMGAREAAVRFRQSFFAFYNGDSTLLELPSKFVAANIDDAKEIATKEVSAHHGLDSAAKILVVSKYKAEFAFQVEQKLRERYAAQVRNNAIEGRTEESLNWYQKRQQKKAYLDSIHENKSWYEKLQHRRAMNKVTMRMLGDGESTTQEMKNRYYAEAMAAEVSLYPAATNEEEIRMLEWVLVTTAADTATEMKQPALKAHMDKMTVGERSEMEMSLYANNYLNNYRSATVDQGLVPPRSIAQPGFTQRFRQNHRNSKLLTILARIVDSGFSDEVGYQTGLKAKIYRNVPTAYDFSSSIQRLAKGMISGTTTRWMFNKGVWGVNIPFASNFLFFLVSPLISAPSQWLNRAFRQQGIQPMGGLGSKIVYGVPYAWVTFGATIPWVLFSVDAILFMKTAGALFKASPIVQTLTSYGEHALPYLPALAVIPILNEIRARREARKTVVAAEREVAKREVERPRTGPSVSEQLAAQRAAAQTTAGRAKLCEALFTRPSAPWPRPTFR